MIDTDSFKEYENILNILKQGTQKDYEELAEQIINFPNGCDSYLGFPWITNAIDNGSLACVKWMLDKNVSLRFINKTGFSPLHSCLERCQQDRHEILKLLIEYGADINVGADIENMAINSWTPLHMAAAYDDIEAIRILLSYGADINIKTAIDNFNTAEEEAQQLGKNQAFQLLLKHRE